MKSSENSFQSENLQVYDEKFCCLAFQNAHLKSNFQLHSLHFTLTFPLTSLQDFRAQRSQIKSESNWLKTIGKFGFPIHLLLKLYQLTIVWWDLVCIGMITYKEMWLSVFYIIVPLHKKKLTNEIAVVSFVNFT